MQTDARNQVSDEYIKHDLNARFFRKLSAALVVALMLIALEVFIGKVYKADMWVSIALYWLVLTVKNLADWRGNVHTIRRDEAVAKINLTVRWDELPGMEGDDGK